MDDANTHVVIDEIKPESETAMDKILSTGATPNLLWTGSNDYNRDSAAVIQATADGINHNINNATVGINHNINTALAGLTSLNVMEKLGAIEGAVPMAACDVKNSIQIAASDINTQTLHQTLNLTNIMHQGHLAVAAGLKDTIHAIDKNACAGITATKDASLLAEKNAWTLSTTIQTEAEKTRALVTRQYEDDLNRRLGDARAEIIELRNEGHIKDRSKEVEVSVNQNVNQSQAQSQAQQQLQILSAIAAGISNLTQIAHATNNNVIAGNTGAVTTGLQTANPVNVRA